VFNVGGYEVMQCLCSEDISVLTFQDLK